MVIRNIYLAKKWGGQVSHGHTLAAIPAEVLKYQTKFKFDIIEKSIKNGIKTVRELILQIYHYSIVSVGLIPTP